MTLVELLVSVTLGLFLISLSMQMFFTSKQTHTALEGNSSLQTNARFGVEYITKGLQLAGYRVAQGKDSDMEEFPAEKGFAVTQVINATDGDAGKSDLLQVRYRGNDDGFVKDCLGNQIGGGDQVVMSYSVNAQGELLCSVDSKGSDVIVRGVDDLQIQLGVNTDGSGIVNKYVSPKSMNSSDWKKVVAVKVGLLVNSENNVRGTEEKQTFSVLGAENKTFNDRRLRRQFIDTINLANRSP